MQLFKEIRELIISARKAVVRNVDTIQVITNFEIGRRIVKHEQRGEIRAKYGEEILSNLSKKLTAEFVKGYSKRNLEYMRKFYFLYQDKYCQKTKTLSAQFNIARMPSDTLEKTQTLSAKLGNPDVIPPLFTLSWSHYVFLIGIDDKNEREFYEIESINENWSLRELERQFNSSLYERLALSRDKKGIKELSQKGQIVEKPEDLIKNPLVLEFLGLVIFTFKSRAKK